MKTRAYLNSTALSMTKLLFMIRGMSDDEINEIMVNDKASQLAKAASDLWAYAEGQKKERIRSHITKRNLEFEQECLDAHHEGRSRPLQDFIDELRPVRNGRRVGLHPYKVRAYNDADETPYRDYTILATDSLDARLIAFALDGGFGWKDQSDWELDDGRIELAITWTEIL